MTVFNHVYAIKHGKDWIETFYDKVDLKKVDNIFIIDTGLKDEDIDMFSKYDKVKLIDADYKNTETSKSKAEKEFKDSVWAKHVLQKTKYFKILSQCGLYPLIMIDGDCKFIKDFSHIISDDDVQVCRRESPAMDGANNNQMWNYIGCYFSLNTKKGIGFIDEWINKINKLIDNPKYSWYETPALNKVLDELKNKYKIGEVSENLVGNRNPDSNTLINHIKISGYKNNGIYQK